MSLLLNKSVNKKRVAFGLSMQNIQKLQEIPRKQRGLCLNQALSDFFEKEERKQKFSNFFALRSKYKNDDNNVVEFLRKNRYE